MRKTQDGDGVYISIGLMISWIPGVGIVLVFEKLLGDCFALGGSKK